MLGSHSSPGGGGVDDHKNNLEYECPIFDRGFGSFFQSGVCITPSTFLFSPHPFKIITILHSLT